LRTSNLQLSGLGGYSITLSASAGGVSGTTRPSALAVLRLIANRLFAVTDAAIQIPRLDDECLLCMDLTSDVGT
jgi:hypothetical protein